MAAGTLDARNRRFSRQPVFDKTGRGDGDTRPVPSSRAGGVRRRPWSRNVVRVVRIEPPPGLRRTTHTTRRLPATVGPVWVWARGRKTVPWSGPTGPGCSATSTGCSPVGGPAVAGQLQTVQPTGYRCQPCLRDIWHDHMLWTGDRVGGEMIDPGSCRSDNVAIGPVPAAGEPGGRRHRSLGSRPGRLRPPGRTGPGRNGGLGTVLDQSTVLLSGAVWMERLAGGRGRGAVGKRRSTGG
ncbi:MAG: hypothetical protein CM1200mP2_31150 [Planctomycetaceae bacterium]|nr:MAG: hypothetical protein CM1200mP2_31150 [Planctomycetaceae bacterium]